MAFQRKVIVLLFVLATVALATANKDPNEDFENFKKSFNKQYGSKGEEASRKAQHAKNVNDIKAHNKRYEEGKESVQLKINEFADQDPAEFSAIRNGVSKPKNRTKGQKVSVVGAAPASWDWRNSPTMGNVVSSVRDQGQCGSCWSFSALGALESAVRMKKGSFGPLLSEQELVDCDQYDNGCGGGWPTNAYYWIYYNNGITSNSQYPYKATNQACQKSGKTNVQTITNWEELDMPTQVETLKSYLQTKGPLSIAVVAGAGQCTWSPYYSTGVISGSPDSNGGNPDHGVVLVGYTSTYWIIKNSWGTGWGQSGFCKVNIDPNNDCGVHKWLAAHPIV